MQSDTTIYQQGQIVGRDAVELQAKENITFNNSIEHLTNQDVLHKTVGIAVTGDKGVMIVSAGNDVNLGGATIEALGKEGAITITAGRDINSTTNTLTAKKDMTQDGDNYLRTYRQTELGTTIEAGGDISIGAKHDIKARNLTVSSDTGSVKVIGEHDVSIENGYSESNDAFALKYKEKGLLNKKETKIKTNDESKNALMSTLSGHTVVVGANNDVTLTSSNVVSTAGTSVLAGHNVRTDAAAEHTLSTASKDVKKSGIMGAGIGIMIGKKQSKDNYYIDENTLYHYNRIRVGEDKLLSHILKSTDVTRGVLDSFTEDGFSAFERSLGITPSYNQYYYGGKLLGDGIGVVGGGVTAGAGIIETGVFTAGGVTAVATPVSVTQIMAGSTLAVHSANNFEKNLTLFAKHNREKSEISTKFNFDEEAPYIRESCLPKDSETILSDGTFEKIGKVEPHGAQVYKKDNKYYYRDTLHYGKKAHLEVFDRRGNHLGEADPLTGKIKPHSVDSKKKLSKEYR